MPPRSPARSGAVTRLACPVRHYPWGSRTDIPRLFGLPHPEPEPWAEVWLGAHPAAPSRLRTEEGEVPLDEAIAADPVGMLGASASSGRASLPFLMKLLAAESPLSLQAHPGPEAARQGFLREERAGIPLGSPRRTYPDPNHKPELLCALTPFVALQGFLPPAEILANIDRIGDGELSRLGERIVRNPSEAGIRAFAAALRDLRPEERADRAARVAARCAGRDDAVSRWVVRLHAAFPGDPCALAPALLNLVALRPGEAIFLAAGHLHTYLGGMGVEVMASSDNVLRAGLTQKHVDCDELFAVASFEPAGPVRIAPREEGPGTVAWPCPAREFELLRTTVDGEWRAPPRDACELVLVVEGAIRAEPGGVGLSAGEAAFVPAGIGTWALHGSGTVFRAREPQPPSRRPDHPIPDRDHPPAPNPRW